MDLEENETKAHELLDEEEQEGRLPLNVVQVSQETLELGLLAQVDEAVEAQKAEERQKIFEQKTEEIMKRIEKLKKLRWTSEDQRSELETLEDMLEKFLSAGPDAVFLDSERGKNFLADLLEDSSNSGRIRLGEATPFELLAEKKSLHVAHPKVEKEVCRKRQAKESMEFDFGVLERIPKKLSLVSDEEYIPSDPSDLSEEEIILEKRQKTSNSASVGRKVVRRRFDLSKDMNAKDDGCDKTFEKRIRACRQSKLESPDFEEDHELDGGLRIPSEIWDKLFK